MNNDVNIMFCGNDKVFDGMVIVVLSIIKYYKGPLNINILTMDLTNIEKRFKAINEEHRILLESIIKEVNKDSSVKLYDLTDIFNDEMNSNNINIDTHYTPYIFLRLLSDKVANLPKKILYLDCDLVVYDDISKLFNIDIEEYEKMTENSEQLKLF